MQTKKALLTISFGTSYEDAEKAILKTEQALTKMMPDADHFRAFTSRMIISKIKKTQHRTILTPPEQMEELIASGYTHIICQPLHIISGIESDKLKAELSSFEHRVETFVIGTPLLYSDEDYLACAHALLDYHGAPISGEALLLMGHGTEHQANHAYQKLQDVFDALGAEHVFVGTAESFPLFEDLLPLILKQGFTSAKLTPFMLVAGDHAQNDLCGEETDSWKSKLATHGISTQSALIGLGEIKAIQDLFCSHLAQLLECGS